MDVTPKYIFEKQNFKTILNSQQIITKHPSIKFAKSSAPILLLFFAWWTSNEILLKPAFHLSAKLITLTIGDWLASFEVNDGFYMVKTILTQKSSTPKTISILSIKPSAYSWGLPISIALILGKAHQHLFTTLLKALILAIPFQAWCVYFSLLLQIIENTEIREWNQFAFRSISADQIGGCYLIGFFLMQPLNIFISNKLLQPKNTELHQMCTHDNSGSTSQQPNSTSPKQAQIITQINSPISNKPPITK